MKEETLCACTYNVSSLYFYRATPAYRHEAQAEWRYRGTCLTVYEKESGGRATPAYRHEAQAEWRYRGTCLTVYGNFKKLIIFLLDFFHTLDIFLKYNVKYKVTHCFNSKEKIVTKGILQGEQ